MLEKILKITKTIDSCKLLYQLDSVLIMIDNFERDLKPLDSRIIEGLKEYYETKENELEDYERDME